MPSIEAPTWYERADWTAPSHADDFFKWWLGNYDPNQDTGSVESPVGYVAVVTVTSVDISNYVSTFGDPWMSESRNFSPGRYLTRQDDNGLIWAMHYGTDEALDADFEEANLTYLTWAEEDSYDDI